MRRQGSLLVMLLLLALPSIPAIAQVLPAPVPTPLELNTRSPEDPRRVQLPTVNISERRAVELAREAYGGNVLRIALVGEGASLRYQLRMEDEGKIFTVYVDANTGAVSTGD